MYDSLGKESAVEGEDTGEDVSLVTENAFTIQGDTQNDILGKNPTFGFLIASQNRRDHRC